MLFYFIAGLAALLVGAELMVRGASRLSLALGMSPLVVGLTVVAFGTSSPELAISISGSWTGSSELVLGNVVGSNVFNLVGVLGASAVVSPEPLALTEGMLRFDIPVMIAVAVLVLPIFFTGHRIDRWEGTLLFGYYVAYVILLVMRALGSVHLDWLMLSLGGFVLPMTLVTLGVFVWREWPDRGSGRTD